MRAVAAIALNTVREHLSDKVLYSLAFFGLFLVGSAILLSRLTIGDYERIVLDMGVGTIKVFCVLVAAFLGVALIGREIDRKTVYVVLAKPVPRVALVLGKYVGLAVTVLINLSMWSAVFMAVLLAEDVPITSVLFESLLLTYAETAVVMGVALLCSAFTTTTLGLFFTMAFYVVGHSVYSLRLAGQGLGGTIAVVTGWATTLFPNLDYFNLQRQVLAHAPLSGSDVMLLLAYAFVYVVAFISLAALIVQRRDLV